MLHVLLMLHCHGGALLILCAGPVPGQRTALTAAVVRPRATYSRQAVVLP